MSKVDSMKRLNKSQRITSRDAANRAAQDLLSKEGSASVRELAEHGAALYPQFSSRLLSSKLRDLVATGDLVRETVRLCKFTDHQVVVYRRKENL